MTDDGSPMMDVTNKGLADGNTIQRVNPLEEKLAYKMGNIFLCFVYTICLFTTPKLVSKNNYVEYTSLAMHVPIWLKDPTGSPEAEREQRRHASHRRN